MNSPKIVRDLETTVKFVGGVDPNGLIAVDGWDGSGKSTLARTIADAASRQYVELDAFLERHRGGYSDHIRYTDLGRQLVDLGTSKVVEGVCVREVLARLGHAPALWIYVKLLSSADTWHPGRWFEFESATEAIAHRQQTLARFSRSSRGPQRVGHLEEELIEYHFKWRPHEASHVIFERIESDA